MTKSQLVAFCISLFAAFLLLHASHSAREANDRTYGIESRLDELSSRLDTIESGSGSSEIEQDVSLIKRRMIDLDYNVSVAQSEIDKVEDRVDSLESESLSRKLSPTSREW